MLRLQNKTALVIGNSSGIGFATTHQFVAEGAQVAITGSGTIHLEQARTALGCVQEFPSGASAIGELLKIANAVVFLASDEPSNVMGSEFIVDGSMTNL